MCKHCETKIPDGPVEGFPNWIKQGEWYKNIITKQESLFHPAAVAMADYVYRTPYERLKKKQ